MARSFTNTRRKLGVVLNSASLSLVITWALVCLGRPALAVGYKKTQECRYFLGQLVPDVIEASIQRARSQGIRIPGNIEELAQRKARIYWLNEEAHRTETARLAVVYLIEEHNQNLSVHLLQLLGTCPPARARVLAEQRAEVELALAIEELEISEADYYENGAEIPLSSYLRENGPLTVAKLQALNHILTMQSLFLELRVDFFKNLSKSVDRDRELSQATRDEVAAALDQTEPTALRDNIPALLGSDQRNSLRVVSARELSEAMATDENVPVAFRSFFEDFLPFLEFLDKYPDLPNSKRTMFLQPFAHYVETVREFYRSPQG